MADDKGMIWGEKNYFNKVQLLVKALHTSNQMHEKAALDGSWVWVPVGYGQVSGNILI